MNFKKNSKGKIKPGFGDVYSPREQKILMIRFAIIGALCALLVSGIVIGMKLLKTSKEASTHTATAQDNQEPTNITSAPVKESSEDASTSKEPTTLKVSFTGDCTLGTDENFDYSTSLNSYYESNGAEYFLANVRSIFEEDDLTIVNFEGTLTTSDQRCENLYAFKGDPEYVSILSSSSVEAANIANNHSHDYGEQGYEDTLANLTSGGITPFGYDTTAVIDVKGVKVGLVGIYELYDHLERTQQLKDNIAKVKEDGAQLIIVEFHWGNEKETSPDTNQTTLGHLAIDEGAHVVIGHHSHVIQPIEKYKGRYIAYSMANFCFGGNSAPSDMDTFIFQQTFTVEGDSVAEDDNINVIPCSISSADGYNNYQPTPVEGDHAQEILDRVNSSIS